MIYTIIALAVLAVIFFFVNKNKKQKQLSKLTAIAFAFVIAGIVFGENRLIGYSLIGIGIALAVIDIVKQNIKYFLRR